MKPIEEIILLEGLKYTDEHIWAKEDNNVYFLGVSDFAQDQLGEVVYVDLPSVGDSFSKNDSFGEIESVKSVNKLFMPVDGEIVAVNEALDNSPTLINASCYEKAWIVQIKISDKNAIEELMNEKQYREFLIK